jgi:hypothetical protein
MKDLLDSLAELVGPRGGCLAAERLVAGDRAQVGDLDYDALAESDRPDDEKRHRCFTHKERTGRYSSASTGPWSR